MGLDLVNIARTGIARTGLARLNAGEVRYSAGATITLPISEIPDRAEGLVYLNDDAWSGWNRPANVSVEKIDDYTRFTATASGYRVGAGFARGFAAAGNQYIRIKYRCSRALFADGRSYPAINYTGWLGSGQQAEWKTVDIHAPGGINDIYFYLFGTDDVVAGDYTDIKFLYVGDLSYDSATGLISSGSGYVTVNPYYGQAGGQAVTSGVALSAAHYIGQADGQTDLSGAADYAIGYAPAADGQLDTSGASDYTPDYVAAASGQLDASGDALALPDYLPDAGGQLDTSGTAPGFPEMLGPAGGEATLSGIASPLAAHYIDTTGGAGGASINGTASVIFTIDVKGLPVFVRRFDGDVRLTLSETGGIIRVRGGQPEMDDGLSTAINISLLSEGDWWGNALAAQGEDIGSGFLAALNAPLTNRARLDIIEAARSALAWLTDTGIAQAVDVSATIPSAGQLALTITIRQPERSPSTFRYTVNWAAQRIQLQEIAA